MILKVRNWEKFQHYKDRRPPWIKLHFALLTSKDWVMLNDSERVLAIACMLLASQSDLDSGCFDADPEYIKRVAYLNTTPNFKPLILHGFLEIINVNASERKQMLANVTTETETDTEGETDTEKRKNSVGSKSKRKSIIYSSDFESLWKMYPGTAGSKKDAFKEYKKANMGAEEMIPIIEKQIFFKSQQKKVGEFFSSFPHLCRWISKERWNDKLELSNISQNRPHERKQFSFPDGEEVNNEM